MSITLALAMQLGFDDLLTVGQIPKDIRGAWDDSTAACLEEHSTSRAHIGANWIAFYEARGILQITTPAGLPNYETSLAMNSLMAGEGTTWQNEFVLAWDGQTPNDITWFEKKDFEYSSGSRASQKWVRCRT